jgi:hypothetical protein
MDEEASDYDALARCRVRLWAECDYLLGIKKREGRKATPAENARFYALVDACGLIDGILDRRAERQRRARIAAGLPVPPRPPVIIVRRIRPRRTRCRCSRPLGARIRSAARAGSPQRRAAAGVGADDPDPDPARILGRFQKTRAWALLSPTGRREIIALANGELTPRAMAAIDRVFQQSAIDRGEHPGAGVLWFSLPFPTRGILVRNADGLLRILQFDPAGSFGDDWQTEGSA